MRYDPTLTTAAPMDGRAYEGVLSRRVFAFLIDYALIGLLWIPAAIVLFFFGLLTLGLGWMLYPALFFIVAGLYFGMWVAGRSQATPGMKMMGIGMMRLDGRKIDFATAVFHVALFWILNAVLTPFILLAGLFLDRSRLAHDMLVGTVVARRD